MAARNGGASDAFQPDAAASDPFEATVAPMQDGSRLSLRFAQVVFEVDPSGAGRIVTFSLDGVNVLVTGGAAWGSGFWPSPQNAWPGGWPPPPEFDSATYAASLDGNVIVMRGTTTSPAFGSLRASKRFWANAAAGIVTIEYTIHNDGTTPTAVAPWEDSRVYPGGLTFFPTASPDLVGFGNFGPVPLTNSQGADWFEYRTGQITTSAKSGADGAEGWAAHVDCHPTLERTCTGAHSPVFIKSFADVAASDFAPGEAEVELYADGAHGFVEFENQGAYGSIPPGGQRAWTVHWSLRYLPDAITPRTGSAPLLDFVRTSLRH
jgi:hypothetical protein